MFISTIRLSLLVAGFAAVALPVSTQAQGKGPKNKSPHVLPPGHVKHAFRTADRDLFRNYYREHRIVVTPLRPEVARLIVVGRPLPVGVVRVPVAREVLVLVPPPAPGYQYAIIGNRIVMLDNRGLVADILDSIF